MYIWPYFSNSSENSIASSLCHSLGKYLNAFSIASFFSFNDNFIGFVEGDDLSKGTADVIITDGFTGNVALKTAEGIAKLIAFYLTDSLKSSLTGKLGMFIAQNSLKSLKDKIDPRGNNGGFFLGLNGLVVKSHGGTDFLGFSNAIQFSVNLARSDVSKKISDLIEENI